MSTIQSVLLWLEFMEPQEIDLGIIKMNQDLPLNDDSKPSSLEAVDQTITHVHDYMAKQALGRRHCVSKNSSTRSYVKKQHQKQRSFLRYQTNRAAISQERFNRYRFKKTKINKTTHHKRHSQRGQ